MARPSILSSLERKFILLVGDLLIIIVSLNVLINHAIDSEFISNQLKFWVFSTGIATYLALSYILDFYNLSKISRRKYIISQSLYITGLYVFVIFIFTVLVFDVSFWRKPLIYFLTLTPLQIGLWRFLFGNVFRIIPVTKNVLYVYDEVTEKNLKEDISEINGSEMETFYRVKLTYSIQQDNAVNKKFFLSAADKVDAFIINTKDYSNIPEPLENILMQSMIKGKEVISYTSFYENTYEAMPIRSHNDSFYEILQFRNKKLDTYRGYSHLALTFS